MADISVLPAVEPAPSRRTRSIDIAGLSALAIVLRLPALLATRHLTFDDGVFGASAVAMRTGALPFRDVFSSQGPLFLPLVRVFDLLGFESLDAPRLLGLSAGILLTVSVYLIGLEISDRLGALVAAVLTTTAGSILWVTGPIAADGPSLAFGALAVALALRIRRNGHLGLAVGVGLASGAALSTKLTALPALVPVAWLLLAPILAGRRGTGGARPIVPTRPLAALLIAAGSALLVWLVPTIGFGVAEVWDQSVTYHSEASGGRDVLANLSKIVSTFVDRDLVIALTAAMAATSAVLGHRRHPRAIGPIVAWLVAAVALLCYIHPLWRPHVSALVPPTALLVGSYRPPARALVIGAIFLVPLGIWRTVDYLVPSEYLPRTQALVDELSSLPPGGLAISDEPGLVWRAGRRTPDDLVDTSILRIESGRITASSLADAASEDDVCAVVVWSTTRFGSFADLADRLDAAGFEEAARYGGPRVLYEKSDCDPAR